jgi:predicted Zn-dependent peptidase
MRTKAPPPGSERNISYPEIPDQQLSNGLRVLVVPDDRLPQVFLTLVLPAGRVSNPDDNLALVSLAAEMIKSGTHSRSAQDISDFVDGRAIEYESEVLMEHSFLSMTFLEDQTEPAFELLTDMVSNANFPDEELVKTKVRWKSHLIAQRSQPNFLANECTFKTFYPNHPYAKVSMTPEHLENTQREGVEETYRHHCGPESAHLLMAGPLDGSRAMELGNRFLGSWANGKMPSINYPPPEDIEGRLVCLIHRPHSVQSQILVAGRTLPKGDPEAIALKVTNQVLGGGASARLFLNLREEKGYTYGAYSRLKSYRHDGLYMAGASVKTEVTRESVEEIFKELEGLGEQLPEEKELERCQQELIGSLIRQMETPASIGVLELDRRIHELPTDFYKNFIPEVRSVTAEKVVEMARRFFDPERLVVTVVADRERVEEKLRGIGELRVYDINGTPL